jgi:hypothetical protein
MIGGWWRFMPGDLESFFDSALSALSWSLLEKWRDYNRRWSRGKMGGGNANKRTNMQRHGRHGHFIAFWARLDCENMRVVPTWLVRRNLDDPRNPVSVGME